MSGLLDLTRLPEWSEFFRAAVIGNLLHFEWRQEGGTWRCRAYDFSRDLSRPIEKITLSDVRHKDKFEALRLATEQSGREIKDEVRRAFSAFRAAATGTAGQIEDLL